MIRFEEFEASGLAVAAMTEQRDGDCCLPGAGTARAVCCARLGISHEALVCGKQVHGRDIAIVDERERGRGALSWDSALPATDGLITATPGIPLAVFVADCVPVFLFAPAARVAGLVHAGRQGTREDIVGRAVHLMQQRLGVCPQEIRALLGPSAGPGRYEVSEPMAAEWHQAGFPVQGRRLDLWEANRRHLVAAGVPEVHILVSGICTIEDGRFFSYRRGDSAARNMAVLMV